MKLYSVLVLMVTLSAAYGLRCYICVGTSQYCKNPESRTCPAGMDRCGIVRENGVVAQSCISSLNCIPGMNCCDEDLCNSAITTGSSVLLLLLSSAIITLFL
ncbi:uncharacterized protein V6R79_001459 [Siganus canaliculatus]